MLLFVFVSYSIGHGEWLPGDWTLSEGSSDTCLTSIDTPSTPGFLKVDSSFTSLSHPNSKWTAQPDFAITPEAYGFSYSSTYKLSRFKMKMKAEVHKFQGDGVYVSFCFVPETDIESLFINFMSANGGYFDKVFSLSGTTRGMLTPEIAMNLKSSNIILAEGNESQLVINTASSLNWSVAKGTGNAVKLSVDVCSGSKGLCRRSIVLYRQVLSKRYAPCSVLFNSPPNLKRYC